MSLRMKPKAYKGGQGLSAHAVMNPRGHKGVPTGLNSKTLELQARIAQNVASLLD